MTVKLVSLTQPVIKIEGKIPTPEQYIVFIARVSNPKNQNNLDTANKLLNYCVRKSHWSIFEQVDMTVEIVTSQAISAQLLRHQAKFQQFSARYAEVESLEPIEFRLQDDKNRQNSLDRIARVSEESVELYTENFLNLINSDSYDDTDRIEEIFDEVQEHLSNSLKLYKRLLKKGIAKETIRFLLPTTMTTRLYMKNNLRNWIHYIQVRALGEGVQKEHREIALQIQAIFKEQFPVISEALGWV